MSHKGAGALFGRRIRRLTLVFALPLACIACTQSEAVDPRTRAPLVRVAVVDVASSGTRSFTGTVAARVQSDLGFRVSGKILSRLVDAGQSVKRGEPLMRIDSIDLKLAVAAQQQAVVAARARAQQAEKDEQRYSELRGTGAISGAAYDQIKAAAEAAEAQLSAAEAQADVARNASEYTELLADSDGVVVETLAEPGQVVSAGQPVIRLAHAGYREAVIQLPETLRPAIGSTGQATLFGNQRLSTPVRLRQLSDAADRVTRTFEARYVLEGDLAHAPLGATVMVQIADDSSFTKKALPLRVPIGALIDIGHGPGVWYVSGDPAQASWKPVVVQLIDSESAQVVGELQRGDRVVALGAHLLGEGDQIRIAGESTATAGVAPAAVAVKGQP